MNLYILYQSSVFDNIVKLIKFSLEEQGFHPIITTKIKPPCMTDYYIIVGAHDLSGGIPKIGFYETYQFEQVNSEHVKNWFNGENGEKYIEILRNSNVIYDYSHKNIELLQTKFNITAKFLPIGYNNALKFEKSFADKTKEVSFIGEINQRRQEIIDNLENNGIPVYTSKNVWREEKSKIIRGSNIVLNIHYYPNASLETTRLLDILTKDTMVISEHSTDPVLDESYKDIVIFATKDNLASTIKYWLDPKNEQLKSKFIANACEKFIQTKFIYPINNKFPTLYSIPKPEDIYPEVEYRPFKAVTLLKNKEDDSVTIAHKKTPTISDMPYASILTITRNRRNLFPIAIANWRKFKYTESRLEWVIVDDSPESISDLFTGIKNIKYIHIPLNEPLSIAEKRNIANEHASHRIRMHMDDDDFYYPNSCYIRAKALIDLNSDDSNIQCVGCTSYGVYHLIDNYDFKLNTNNLSEASMCYYKEFWEEQKFEQDDRGESYPFLKNRRSQVMTLPFEFVFFAITHTLNYTKNLRTIPITNRKKSHTLFNSIDIESQLLLNKIYKKIIK